MKHSKEQLRLANITAEKLYKSTIEKQLSVITNPVDKAVWVTSAAEIGKSIENGDIDVDELLRYQA